MHARTFLLLLLCSGIAVAGQTGYKVTRDDGTVEFTDQPEPGAKPIPLSDAPTYTHRTPDASVLGTGPTKPQPPIPAYEQVVIKQPVQDAVSWRNQGPVTVMVEVRPALRVEEGHRIVILLDGKPAAEGTTTRYTLEQVYRGSHTLVAGVDDAQGHALVRSKPLTFHVRQRSVLFNKKP